MESSRPEGGIWNDWEQSMLGSSMIPDPSQCRPTVGRVTSLVGEKLGSVQEVELPPQPALVVDPE